MFEEKNEIPQTESESPETQNLVDFFELLMKIDKRNESKQE
jgi:hypothetical protein